MGADAITLDPTSLRRQADEVIFERKKAAEAQEAAAAARLDEEVERLLPIIRKEVQEAIVVAAADGRTDTEISKRWINDMHFRAVGVIYGRIREELKDAGFRAHTSSRSMKMSDDDPGTDHHILDVRWAE